MLSGKYKPALIAVGLALVLLGYVFDCADGMLARHRGVASPAGGTLDLLGDLVVHLAYGSSLATVGGVHDVWQVLFVSFFAAPPLTNFLNAALRRQTGGQSSGQPSRISSLADYPVQCIVLSLAAFFSFEVFVALAVITASLSAGLVARLASRCLKQTGSSPR